MQQAARARSDRGVQRKLREQVLAASTSCRRWCACARMNLYLHGIGDGESPIESRPTRCSATPGRPLRRDPDQSAVRQEAELPDRRATTARSRPSARTTTAQDFIVTTSNKQLNFLQHIMTILDEQRPRRRWCCPTTCCSRAAAGETIRRGCSTTSTSTRCCACPPASSTSRA